ncbi:hypothetical protein [uncultured Gimesia sp.]|uniref:hypothetical protein n=1 Tax=uncultured Gimesia sp. TaxID=1678688 RepID=UPI00262E3C3C|nr:hypothetical protein [uncultured Gimesia sp.]
MSNWIQLDAQRLDQTTHENQNGVDIYFGLSPFDIPEAIRSHVDKSNDRLKIEFKYLDDPEEEKMEWSDKDSSLSVGKNSGCVYSISVNMKPLEEISGKSSLLKEFEDAVKGFIAEKHLTTVEESHYDVARKALAEKAEELLVIP